MKSFFSTSPHSAHPAPTFIFGNTMNGGELNWGKGEASPQTLLPYPRQVGVRGGEMVVLKNKLEVLINPTVTELRVCLETRGMERRLTGLPGCS